MKVPILQVSLCSTVEWFATFALLRYKEYLHQFRFAQFANKALSSTYFAILALLELCKIICFPSLCSGTKYISTARSARCANKVSFRFHFYGLANFVYMLPFTTRWIKKYILLDGNGKTISNNWQLFSCLPNARIQKTWKKSQDGFFRTNLNRAKKCYQMGWKRHREISMKSL